jgi:hypothetical protein
MPGIDIRIGRNNSISGSARAVGFPLIDGGAAATETGVGVGYGVVVGVTLGWAGNGPGNSVEVELGTTTVGLADIIAARVAVDVGFDPDTTGVAEG